MEPAGTMIDAVFIDGKTVRVTESPAAGVRAIDLASRHSDVGTSVYPEYV